MVMGTQRKVVNNMDTQKIFEIINLDRNATPEEELIAYKKFFKFLK